MFTVDDIVACTGGQLLRTGIKRRITGINTDTRTIKKGQAFLAIRGNHFDGHEFIKQAVSRGASCLIVDGNAPCSAYNRAKDGSWVIRVADTVVALGDIARFHRNRFSIPLIAVTGSNGKTTTKEMIASCLGGAGRVLKTEGTKNNHIGVPLTLLQLNARHTHAVVELGTNHPGEIALLARIARPTIGVITNIGPSHLEFLGDLSGVMREKCSLGSSLRPPAIMIINADDLMLKEQAQSVARSPLVLSYALHTPADFCLTKWQFGNGAYSFLVNGTHRLRAKMLGVHNLYNALAAVAVARVLGVSYAGIAAGLKRCRLPEKRLRIAQIGRVRYIDDSYNSNPLSLRSALETFWQMPVKGRRILVMGDMLELGQKEELFHREAAETVCRVCDILITVGTLSRLCADSARTFGLEDSRIHVCESSQQARDILLTTVRPRSGDVVLVKGSRSMAMEKVFEAG